MDGFSRVLMTADPKLGAAYLTMAQAAGVKDKEPFHLVMNEGAPSKHAKAVKEQFAKKGLDWRNHLPSQINYLEVSKLSNGLKSDGAMVDKEKGGRFRYAMTPEGLHEGLTRYTKQTKEKDTAFNRFKNTSPDGQKIRNEAQVNIIQTLLTGDNKSYWFDAINSLDIVFGGVNRLSPQSGFGFFSDNILASNSRFGGAGQIQGTTNATVAEQKQEIEIQPLEVFTRTLKLAPDATGDMNAYIEAVIASGGQQMISAQEATKNIVEREIYGSIVNETGASVDNNLFSSILPGVSSPSGLNGANIFQFIQNFGIALRLFSEGEHNMRPKDLVVPVEDYWLLTTTLSAAFSSAASSQLGFAITPIQYIEQNLNMNVVPSNALGEASNQLRTWLVTSEAINNPNRHPTYGMMHVDEGSLYYNFSGVRFTAPQTAPVHAMRYSEVAFYRRRAWATFTWT